MIIKGKSRADAIQAGNYLSEKGQNQKIALIEIKGTLSQDIGGAALEMETIAACSRAKKPFYHASINPQENETLTPEQWEKAVDLLEKNLNLEGHPRIVVEHEKDGRAHRHILWSRVSPETLKAVRMSHNFANHEKTARQLEKDFNLECVRGVHVLEEGEERADRAPTNNEIEQGKKTGVNVRKWRGEVREIAAGVEGGGAELIAALEEKGHIVARGEKVEFLLLDPSGKPHRMAQTLGIKVKDLKEKLADIDPAKLPEEIRARAIQKEMVAKLAAQKEEEEKRREQEQKAEAAKDAATMYNRGGMVSQQRGATRHAKDKKKALNNSAFLPVRPDLQKQEEEQRRKQEEAARYQSSRAGNRKEEGTKADDIRDRTEQTDRKQRRTAQDALKEIREAGRAARSRARDRGDDWERERER